MHDKQGLSDGLLGVLLVIVVTWIWGFAAGCFWISFLLPKILAFANRSI